MLWTDDNDNEMYILQCPKDENNKYDYKNKVYFAYSPEDIDRTMDINEKDAMDHFCKFF